MPVGSFHGLLASAGMKTNFDSKSACLNSPMSVQCLGRQKEIFQVLHLPRGMYFSHMIRHLEKCRMNFKKCAFKKPKWNKVSWPIPLSFRWSPWWPGTYNSKDHIFLFVDLPQTFPPIHGSTSRSPGTDPPLPALGWESHSDASSVDPLNLNSTLKTPSLIFILQPITSLEVAVGEKSNLCQGSDHSWTFIPHTVISQPPVSIQESMSWFLFLFLHTQSFSRVPCYLTNDRNPQHPCQVLAMNWFPFLSFFHFFFLPWDNEAEISLCPDLEFLQPFNFIAQQSLQLCLWEGWRSLKFIWYWVSRRRSAISSYCLPHHVGSDRLPSPWESVNKWMIITCCPLCLLSLTWSPLGPKARVSK